MVNYLRFRSVVGGCSNAKSVMLAVRLAYARWVKGMLHG